jgi:hypothetical protein
LHCAVLAVAFLAFVLAISAAVDPTWVSASQTTTTKDSDNNDVDITERYSYGLTETVQARPAYLQKPKEKYAAKISVSPNALLAQLNVANALLKPSDPVVLVRPAAHYRYLAIFMAFDFRS